jgi:SSS family solute:Na+ symporter
LIIFSGVLIFETMGVPFWTGAIIIVLATGFYTVLGGLKAVIYIDMVQAFILIASCGAVTYFGLSQLGGWDEMIRTIEQASTKPGNPPLERFFNLWRPMTDTQYPWTGMLFGAPILGVWYWCTDQFIVQRTLSAKDISNARRGALFAGFLKLLPVFIFFIPGVIAYALLQKGMLDFSTSNADYALPALITGFLPVGLKGLAIAGLLAALMSSLSSAFNSSSTLFTIDFYKQYKPKASEKELVWTIGNGRTGICKSRLDSFHEITHGRRDILLSPKYSSLHLATHCSGVFIWIILQMDQCKGRNCFLMDGFCIRRVSPGYRIYEQGRNH